MLSSCKSENLRNFRFKRPSTIIVGMFCKCFASQFWISKIVAIKIENGRYYVNRMNLPIFQFKFWLSTSKISWRGEMWELREFKSLMLDIVCCVSTGEWLISIILLVFSTRGCQHWSCRRGSQGLSGKLRPEQPGHWRWCCRPAGMLQLPLMLQLSRGWLLTNRLLQGWELLGIAGQAW